MLGLAVPAPAFADETPKKGGVLRVGMFVKDQKDPRNYDWPEMGNVARQFLNSLVTYTRQFTFEPALLEKGTSTRTQPNISCTCAQELPGTTATPSPPTTSSSTSTGGATSRSKAIRWPRAWRP